MTNNWLGAYIVFHMHNVCSKVIFLHSSESILQMMCVKYSDDRQVV